MTSRLRVNTIQSSAGLSTITVGASSVSFGDIEASKLTASTGILFGTDTAAANTLDDYEEGTWTPVFKGNTTAGSYTHGGPCTYTKIGNVVHVRGTLNNITTVSAGSGSLRIGGLPFVNDASTNARQIGTAQVASFNSSATDIYGICVRTPIGSSELDLIGSRLGLGLYTFQVTDKVNDTADISLQITYEIEPV